MSYKNKPATGNYLPHGCNFPRCAMRAGERGATAGPAPRADPRPRSPRGGADTGWGLRGPGAAAAGPSAGQGGSGGSPAPRGRRAAVRGSGAAALLAPNGRGGLTEGARSSSGRRGGGPAGVRSRAGGAAALGTGRRDVSPPPEVGSRRRKRRAARLQRGGLRLPLSGRRGRAGICRPAGTRQPGRPAERGAAGACGGVSPGLAAGGEREAAALRLGGRGARSKRGFSVLHAARREAPPRLSQHFPAVSDTPLRMNGIIQPGSRTHAQENLN